MKIIGKSLNAMMSRTCWEKKKNRDNEQMKGDWEKMLIILQAGW